MLNDYLKTLPQYLLPKAGITAIAGQFANVKKPAIKNYLIQHFINQYKVDMSEALIENPEDYACFNDFFIRHLKPGLRPLADADIVSPVDGAISEIGKIEQGQLLQAKKRYYTVEELLGADSKQCEPFQEGRFATLYLSPKDYHRVHSPIDCHLKKMTYLPGQLFSVQPSTSRVIPKLFARNERLAMYFDTQAGPMAMVMVGATIVGAIGTSWHGDIKRSKQSVHFDYEHEELAHKTFHQGTELGYFKLGSTVILLFSNKTAMQWEKNLKAGDTLRLGQALGYLK